VEFTELIIRILIPLKIASQNRTTYELTMAGTIIAIFNLIFWLTNQCLISLDEATLSLRKNWSVVPYRLIVALLCIITTLIVWKRADKEYKELKSLFKQSKWSFCCYKKRPKSNDITLKDKKMNIDKLIKETNPNSPLADMNF
jgi:hypothetical protein